jgi:P27 family predicted phage terminase small subunit
MARGRKPVPTQLKIVRGNPGKKALPKGEPRPDASMPTPPDFLGEVALRMWQYQAPLLHTAGILTAVDGPTLAVYCQAFERWALAEQRIAAEGMTVASPNGYEIAHPCVSIAKAAWDAMRQFGTELGLSPAARPKLSKGETRPDDPLEVFIQKKQREKHDNSL